jgi:AAA ATPase domain
VSIRDELKTIHAAIESKQLPASFDELFSPLWDDEAKRFHVQETYILDYKETIPERFNDGYGAGIVRLALAFHNSFGGIIVFGVKDRALTIEGVTKPFDVESFNRMLTDFGGVNIECISKLYTIKLETGEKTIVGLLVPRRGVTQPARLTKQLTTYSPGRLWVRDRHEVVEAGVRHLATLFSDRTALPSDTESESKFPVHRSFPPSPATVKEFVNRGDLLANLWAWFVLGDQPRLYLHGPGGSGKSTLAFEFARLLAEHGHTVRAKNGDRLDYVIYISGKETELNPLTGNQQTFALRQFGDAQEQFAQILYHSGSLKQSDLENATPELIDGLLKELFSSFSGLIVLDDIDALSRRGLDTGEESLFMKAILASKRTRILYTLRFPPAHALNSALAVPGLEPSSEFFEFLEVCCKQFDVSSPPTHKIPKLQEITNRLPLLVETIVGLRRYCGNYDDALHLFHERGGDEARRYLYQREYDRLDNTGKSRQVLAGLLLLREPISFSAFAGLFQFSREQVREALSECSSVFLSTFEGADGDTMYQLTPPCVPFIRLVSEELTYFNELATRVKHFKSEGMRSTPEEAAVIVSMEALIRRKSFQEIVNIGENFPRHAAVLVNPKVRSLLGQAYSELGPNFREKARECFKHAEGLGHRDVFMMRRWFNMELYSGYGLSEAERICQNMIGDEKVGPRTQSEFWSKLGACYLARANGVIGVNRDKGLEHLRNSIVCYLEGLWVGTKVKDFDLSDNLIWLEKPLHRLIVAMRSDIEEFFKLLEALADRKHDVVEEGISLVLEYLTRSPVPADLKLRQKLKGLCARTVARIVRTTRSPSSYPGLSMIVDALERIREELERRETLATAKPA